MQINENELHFVTEESRPVVLKDLDYILPEGEIEVMGSSEPIHNLVHYLNATTAKSQHSDLQSEIVQSNGKLLVDLIEHLGGKKIQFKVTPGLGICTRNEM